MLRLRTVWQRFTSLTWSRKGSILGAGALAVLAVALTATIMTRGSGSDDHDTDATETAAATSDVRSGNPTVAPAPVDGTGETARPVRLAYRVTPMVEAATYRKMVGFSIAPGAPDEAAVFTQDGAIWKVWLQGDRPPAALGDVSDRLISEHGYEEGLLGLAFSPDFQRDGQVYLYYTAGEPRRSVLSRIQVVDDALVLASERVLLEVPQPDAVHNGGQLAFGPDGYLYVSVGDGGPMGDPSGHGQNPATLLGSILRLDVSGEGYAIPPDNPFVGRADARPEIYAYGFRNAWRFSFDRATGDMWAGDVGENTWEEIDHVIPGGNYGWSVLEGEMCFRRPGCEVGGLVPPRAVYGRDLGCAVTGGYVYRGASMPELNGWFVYGDYCTGNIWGANTDDDSAPVLLAETDLRIASFGELPDGELVVISLLGGISRLERAR